jgi:hypothetical protein
MITFSARPLTDDEKQALLKRLPSFYKLLEEYALVFIGVVMALLIPLLIVDRYFHVSSTVQFIYCICAGILAVPIIIYVRKKYGAGHPGKKQDVLNMDYEVVHVKTSRAIKREDVDDFGVAFYVSVVHDGITKTLYLWGQYLDMLTYDNLFPNTEFEFARKKGSEEFVDFKLFGQHFKEEKTLPAFNKVVWNAGTYPVNGQLLNITIDEVV